MDHHVYRSTRRYKQLKYRALIVDDERIILNGIMRLPIWLSLDMEPVAAMTGLQDRKSTRLNSSH